MHELAMQACTNWLCRHALHTNPINKSSFSMHHMQACTNWLCTNWLCTNWRHIYLAGRRTPSLQPPPDARAHELTCTELYFFFLVFFSLSTIQPRNLHISSLALFLPFFFFFLAVRARRHKEARREEGIRAWRVGRRSWERGVCI